MSIGIRITNCRGASFYITNSISPPLHLMAQWGYTLQFISSFNVSHFIASLSDFDIATLCHRFTTNGQSNRQFIEQAIYSGQLNVLPEIKQSDLGGNHTFIDTMRTPVKMHDSEQKEARSLIVVRSDIKVTLRKIVDQERIQADEIDKAYQQQSTYGKASAHVSSFANGLYETGKSLLTWLKDVNDVVSLNQRMLRILMAAQVASHLETDNRYALFEKTLNALDKKEIVEVLGFDPSLVTTEKLTEVYSLAKLVHDDQTTRLIITQFIEDYIKAQHQLEWSEFSGGASFEVILTALLAVVTGGVGAVASLGAQARKISQLKKLGELLSELAELLKQLPKPKKMTLRQLKEVEDKKGRKRQHKTVEKEQNPIDSVDKGKENIVSRPYKTKDGIPIHYFSKDEIKFKTQYSGSEYFFYIDGKNDMLELAYTTVDPEEKSLEFYISNAFNDGVVLKGDDFGLTNEILTQSIDIYTNQHGASPEFLNGSIIKKNLSNFQKEYDQIRTISSEGRSLSEISEEAIKNISFGRERVNLGYEDISVDVLTVKTVNVDGKTLRDVPSNVIITARKKDA